MILETHTHRGYLVERIDSNAGRPWRWRHPDARGFPGDPRIGYERERAEAERAVDQAIEEWGALD